MVLADTGYVMFMIMANHDSGKSQTSIINTDI